MEANTISNDINKFQSGVSEMPATSADHHESEENSKSAYCMPKIILLPCTDINEDNVYLMPRRTEEMLRSPLHRDSRSSSFMTPKTMQPQLEPRRRKELLQSPLQQDMRSSCKLTPEEAKHVSLQPRRTKKSPAKQPEMLTTPSKDLLEPRRTKELLKSPLHKDMRATMQNNSSKILFQTPKKQNVNLFESNSKNIYSEPRRNKELLQSPLHKDMRAQMLGKGTKNSHKEVQNHKKVLQSVESKENVKTPSSHVIKPISNIYSEPRRIKELLQSPLHKDMRARMLPQPSKSIYSEPRRTKELLYAQNQGNEAYSARRKLQFNKQQGDLRFQRILSYLRSVFKSVSTRDLQNLGVQNFIIIMKHLLETAEVVVVPLNQSNYIEQIFKAMEQLNYPHKIMRSVLLMPSASLTQVLQLLDFLIEMVSKKNEDNHLNVAKVETLELQLQLVQLEKEDIKTTFK
ncbi:uncharacterized protein LOC132790949 [Drosophila nasuta]|uniref:uncharacterized protein LOC132790949 n=1 Tax=Drosophila nasuta TaxID=42062 RepID=UPI00295F0176|nr:uncharacterized protein LOC132790949 [Drosophila nasuta]